MQQNATRFLDAILIRKLHQEFSSAYTTHDLVNAELLTAVVEAARQPQRSMHSNRMIAESAAIYLHGIVINKPFSHTNHKTALASALSFLALNGYALQMAALDAAQLVRDVDAGQISVENLTAILHRHLIQILMV